MDKLVHGEDTNEGKTAMFVRTFSGLSDADQAEIMNIMRFKKRYRESIDD